MDASAPASTSSTTSSAHAGGNSAEVDWAAMKREREMQEETALRALDQLWLRYLREKRIRALSASVKM